MHRGGTAALAVAAALVVFSESAGAQGRHYAEQAEADLPRFDELFETADKAYVGAVNSAAERASGALEAREERVEDIVRRARAAEQAVEAPAQDEGSATPEPAPPDDGYSYEFSDDPAAGKPAASFEGLLLEGVLRFVERRAREEAVRYVVKRLAAQLCDDEGDSGGLLPTTCGLLSTVGRLPEMVAPLELLRQSVRTDLLRLPQRLADHAELRGEHPRLSCGLVLGGAVGESLMSGEQADELIRMMLEELTGKSCQLALGGSSGELEAWSIRVRAALTAIEATLPQSGAPRPRRIRRQATELISQRAAPSIDGFYRAINYKGQLMGKLAAVNSGPDELLRDAAALRAELDEIADQLESAKEQADEQFAAARKAIADGLAPVIERLAAPVAHLTRTLRAIRDTSSEDEGAAAQVQAGLEQASSQLALILETLLIDIADKRAEAEAMARLVVGASRFPRGEFTLGMAAMIGSGMLPAEQQPYRTLISFSELLTGMANAQSSQEVAALIESAAPPAGNWERKRRGFTVGLSAQFGAAAGIGWTRHDGRSHRSTEIGAYIPLGIDLARPAGSLGTVGLLLQVLDLGALSSTRLSDDDDIDSAPSFDLTTVFAPGVALYVGIGQTPLAVSLSANYAPSLRVVTATEETAADLRVQLGLAIDVPILLF